MWLGIIGILVLVISITALLLSPRNKKGIWKGSNVVITGGSAGLGFGIAKEIVQLGGSVVILARNPERLQEAKESIQNLIKNEEQKVLAIPTDVTDEENIEKVLQEIKENGMNVDFLFCCAGVAKPGFFLDTPTETFDQQIQLNYMGIVKSLKVFVPEIMKSNHKQKRVVLVSSALGLFGFIGYSQYSATKFAVRGLAECLRNEFILYDIGVSIFHASSMDSPGFAVEEQTKPEITRKIEGQSTLFTPEQAASHCLRAVEQGKFHICSDYDIELMRFLGNGLTPRNYTFFELLLAPFAPLIGFIARRFVFDRPVIIERSKNKSKNT